jgi:hypothetical protein
MAGKLYLAAPPNQQWPLTIDDLTTQLHRRFPDALISRRTSAITRNDVLDFEVTLADGEMRHGTYVDGGKFALSDGSPSDWADTLAWFLSLLPDGTPAVAMVDEGADVVTVPAQIRSPQAVAAFYAALS